MRSGLLLCFPSWRSKRRLCFGGSDRTAGDLGQVEYGPSDISMGGVFREYNGFRRESNYERVQSPERTRLMGPAVKEKNLMKRLSYLSPAANCTELVNCDH